MTDKNRVVLQKSIFRILASMDSMREAVKKIEKVRDSVAEEYEQLPDEDSKTTKAEELSNSIELMDHIIDAAEDLERLSEDLDALRRV